MSLRDSIAISVLVTCAFQRGGGTITRPGHDSLFKAGVAWPQTALGLKQCHGPLRVRGHSPAHALSAPPSCAPAFLSAVRAPPVVQLSCPGAARRCGGVGGAAGGSSRGTRGAGRCGAVGASACANRSSSLSVASIECVCECISAAGVTGHSPNGILDCWTELRRRTSKDEEQTAHSTDQLESARRRTGPVLSETSGTSCWHHLPARPAPVRTAPGSTSSLRGRTICVSVATPPMSGMSAEPN